MPGERDAVLGRALRAAGLGRICGVLTTLLVLVPWPKWLDGFTILCSIAGCVFSLAALVLSARCGATGILLRRSAIFLGLGLSLWPWVLVPALLWFGGGLGPGP